MHLANIETAEGLAEGLEAQAERLPKSFRVQVLRKLGQARRGMEAGLDMTGVLQTLAKRVEEIKKRCRIEDDVVHPVPTKVFNTPQRLLMEVFDRHVVG